MTVLAYELLAAGMPTAEVPAWIARGFWLADGDEEYRSVVDDPTYGALAGAYAIPAAWREPVTPYDVPSLRRDAVIIASVAGKSPIVAEWLQSGPVTIPEWVLDTARVAAAAPQAGIDPYETALTETRRPFDDHRDEIAYRMSRVDGALDALRDKI